MLRSLCLFVALLFIAVELFGFHEAALGMHRASNERLVQKLVENGVLKNRRVIEAMKKVDRAKFVDQRLVLSAYEDSPSPIGKGQTISAPHMHAFALEFLEPFLQSGAKALDVGSGSGYLSACMAQLVAPEGKVYGIEYVPDLAVIGKQNAVNAVPNLFKTGVLSIEHGDGYKGVPDAAPFDCIHVGAAAPHIPEALVMQLKAPGRMIIPVGPQYGDQYLVQVDKDATGKVTTERLFGVRYVPLVEDDKAED